jgi:hypothetical protein
LTIVITSQVGGAARVGIATSHEQTVAAIQGAKAGVNAPTVGISPEPRSGIDMNTIMLKTGNKTVLDPRPPVQNDPGHRASQQRIFVGDGCARAGTRRRETGDGLHCDISDDCSRG